MKKYVGFAVTASVLLAASVAWAGTAGAPPGAGGGGSGPEPAVYALILFSLIPGVYFARKAMARSQAE